MKTPSCSVLTAEGAIEYVYDAAFFDALAALVVPKGFVVGFCLLILPRVNPAVSAVFGIEVLYRRSEPAKSTILSKLCFTLSLLLSWRVMRTWKT